MSPKRRNKENRGLPRGWRFRYGAYYFRVPPDQKDKWDGKSEFLLGKNLATAHRVFADRIGDVHTDTRLYSELADRYLVEVLPDKAKGTREQYSLALRRLTPAFGHMLVDAITPQHAYAYFDAMLHAGHSIASAKADVSVLRHTLTMAVRWGVIARNPLIGQLRLPIQKSPTRYLQDWEIDEILSLNGTGRGIRVLLPYIEFKLLTGLRRSDILRMRLSAGDHDDGIHVMPHKTKDSSGRKLIFEWTPELRAIWNTILSIPPHRKFGNEHLFVTRDGNPYMDEEGDCNGFDSMWQRFVAKVKRDTRVTEHFTEKDIRAKVGSEMETDKAASEILGNSPEIARRHYRRKPTVVTPFKRKSKQ